MYKSLVKQGLDIPAPMKALYSLNAREVFIIETYLRLSGSEDLRAVDVLYYLDSLYYFSKEDKIDLTHSLLDIDKMFKSYINKKNNTQSKKKNIK